MKKLILLLFIPLVFACSNDGDCSSDSIITNKELAEQVKEHMAEVFKENPEFENIEIDDLLIIRLGGYNYDEGVYNYEGILTITDTEYKSSGSHSVSVGFDGETFRWKINGYFAEFRFWRYANLR
tara:strand:+ start:3230 stop:3604 length:375 start_codon:yes stop_codon:yes gene_type:complete